MKIYKNRYKYNWVSPYSVKECFFFWKKDYNAFKNEPPVWLTKACEGWEKIANFFNPKIDYVKIDYWDTWNMDSTLTPIILPMLKQLKAVKHGSPFVDDKDLPKELQRPKITKAQLAKYDPDYQDFMIHERWDWVMNEMIWAFEQLNDPEHDTKFFDHSKVDRSESISDQINKTKFDKEGYNAHQERIQRGLTLFGKYYRGLWD